MEVCSPTTSPSCSPSEVGDSFTQNSLYEKIRRFVKTVVFPSLVSVCLTTLGFIAYALDKTPLTSFIFGVSLGLSVSYFIFYIQRKQLKNTHENHSFFDPSLNKVSEALKTAFESFREMNKNSGALLEIFKTRLTDELSEGESHLRNIKTQLSEMQRNGFSIIKESQDINTNIESLKLKIQGSHQLYLNASRRYITGLIAKEKEYATQSNDSPNTRDIERKALWERGLFQILYNQALDDLQAARTTLNDFKMQYSTTLSLDDKIKAVTQLESDLSRFDSEMESIIQEQQRGSPKKQKTFIQRLRDIDIFAILIDEQISAEQKSEVNHEFSH